MDETILVNYLQGECNDEEAARVEAWCEEGPENRKTLEQLYYTLFVGERIAVMNTVDTEASLDQFKSAIREKEKKAKRKSISIRWGRYATVAAAFLTGLVFAGGIAWGLLSNKLSDYEVITAAGQRAQTVLPDGSKVWLNASSKIKQPLSNLQAYVIPPSMANDNVSFSSANAIRACFFLICSRRYSHQREAKSKIRKRTNEATKAPHKNGYSSLNGILIIR